MICRQVNTALCSFGMSGKIFHAPFVHTHPGLHLHGIVERSNKEAKEVYPQIRSYDSIDEMLADDLVELVIVTTPNGTHYNFAKQALLAGKHVVVEKPFVITTEQGKELIAIAEQQKKLLTVYHNRRYDSDSLLTAKVITEGRLGSIVEAEFHYDRYRLSISPKTHKEAAVPGAGLLYDLGAHLIDQALQLFGLPTAVFADLAAMRPNSAVDDYFEVLLFYPGKRVRLKASNLVMAPLPAIAVYGTQGTFIKLRGDVQETDLLAGKTPDTNHWGIEAQSTAGQLTTGDGAHKETINMQAPPGNFMAFFDNVYNVIRNNEKPAVTAQQGLEVIHVIEAAIKSNAEQKVIPYVPLSL